MSTAAPKKANPWGNYTRATSEPKHRTIGMSFGEVGTGKTRFWLTAPGPILVQSLDKGLEGVVEKILEDNPDKAVYVKEYDWNPQADDFDQDYAIRVRDEIVTDYKFGLANARTILWDRETDIWEVFRYAEFGGPSDAPKDYARLNQRFFHLINDAKSVPDVNVGFIQAMKDQWGSEVVVDAQSGRSKKKPIQTGKRVKTGFSRLDELVMVELHHSREDGEFKIEIGKCRQNAAFQDSEHPGGLTFPQLGTLLIEGSNEEDWS